MAGKRYEYTNQIDWRYLGPAFRGIDADLTALEEGGAGGTPSGGIDVVVNADGTATIIFDEA